MRWAAKRYTSCMNFSLLLEFYPVVYGACQRIRIDAARRRRINPVERSQSIPRTIIYGISSGGWCSEVRPQTLVGSGLLAHRFAGAHELPAERLHYRALSTGMPRTRSAVSPCVGIGTALGHTESCSRRAATPLGACTGAGSDHRRRRWVARDCAAAAHAPRASAAHSSDRSPPMRCLCR